MKKFIALLIAVIVSTSPILASAHGLSHDRRDRDDEDESGRITICLVFGNSNNVVATSSAGLPAGSFTINLGETTSIASSTIFTKTWNASSFAPNESIIADSPDAECVEVEDLDESASYFYSPLNVSGTGWNAPLYNDQLIGEVHTTSDFFAYHTDIYANTFPLANSNSDINLALTEGERVFVMYVTYSNNNGGGGGGVTPPPANTVPVLTIIGANPTSVVEGSTYTDQGATSTDAEDGDLTSHIITTGSVNTAIAGGYTITYSVTDSKGASASAMRTVNVTPAPANTCEINIVSDSSTQVTGGAAAVATYSANTRWTASIPGATWIWKTFLVENPTTDESTTFEREFTLAASTTQATLVVAADNSYTVKVNGQDVGSDNTEFNYFNENKHTYNVAAFLNPGTNKVVFTVKNWGLMNSTAQSNPAGLLYKLNIKKNDPACGGTVVNTPPTITLLGNNPFAVATDTAFIDLGATSTDAEDGDLTSHIVVTGSVNASTTGTYTLTYSVTDSGGLGATTTRTVLINSTSTTTPPTTGTTTPPTNTGGGSSTTSTGGGGGGSSIGGHRRDISGITGVGQVLGASAECSYLRDYLRRDWNNDKVEMLKLQSFLNIFEGETLTLNSTFDQATYDAVSRFQDKYFDDILAPWGHNAPTGFVYILTKKKVNEIYCNTTLSLTDAQKEEITAFRSYLEGLNTNPNGGNNDLDVSGSIGIKDNNSDKGQNIIGNIASSVAGTVTSTINKVTDNTALRNLAVSLFGTPKGLGEVSSTYLLILLAIILLAVFWPRSKDGVKPSIAVLEKKIASEPIEMPSASIGKDIPSETVVADEPKDEIVEDKKDDDDTPPSIFNNPSDPSTNPPAQGTHGFKNIIG